MGDMAISNSIGSNVFDILIGLGLPWTLQTLAIDYGSTVSAECRNQLLLFNDLFCKCLTLSLQAFFSFKSPSTASVFGNFHKNVVAPRICFV